MNGLWLAVLNPLAWMWPRTVNSRTGLANRSYLSCQHWWIVSGCFWSLMLSNPRPLWDPQWGRGERWLWYLPWIWQDRASVRLGFCNSYMFLYISSSAFTLMSPLTETSKGSNIYCPSHWMDSSLGRWATRQDLWQGLKTQITTRRVTLLEQKHN